MPHNAAADGWTFTDDLGRTVTRDEAPTRVVALSDIAYSLLNYGVEPVGMFGYSGVSDDVRFDDMDMSGIAELGAVYGEVNLEALAALDPDLIVTNQYPVDAEGTLDPAAPLYGFADSGQQAAAEEIASIVTIADRACERGANVMVFYAEPSNIYIAKAPDDPSLRMYAELGVDFVDPGGADFCWEIVSWERIGTLPADVVLYSERGMLADDLMAQPTFAATPAAAAGQVYPGVFAGMDYVSSSAYMNGLAGFESAEVVAAECRPAGGVEASPGRSAHSGRPVLSMPSAAA